MRTVTSPPDLTTLLTHHVPIAWRDHRRGSVHLLLGQSTTPMRIRGVSLSEMRTHVRVGDKRDSLSLLFEGRVYVPFTHHCPRGLARGPAEAPMFDFLKVHVPDRLKKLPPVASERYAEYLAQNAVERPEQAAAIRAARIVADTVIHDGDSLLRVLDPAPDEDPRLAAQRGLRADLSALHEAHISLPASLPIDMRLRDAMWSLRRTYALALADALTEDEVRDARALAREASVTIESRHPHARKREHLARVILNLAPPPPPAEDEASLCLL